MEQGQKAVQSVIREMKERDAQKAQEWPPRDESKETKSAPSLANVTPGKSNQQNKELNQN
jgi:hypothetical protein